MAHLVSRWGSDSFPSGAYPLVWCRSSGIVLPTFRGHEGPNAENVIGTGDGWLTELSTTDLKELFALRKEAVAW